MAGVLRCSLPKALISDDHGRPSTEFKRGEGSFLGTSPDTMSSIPFQIVVVCQLRTSDNVMQGKYTHAEGSPYQPLLGLTIGRTRMVDESGCAAHHCRINLEIRAVQHQQSCQPEDMYLMKSHFKPDDLPIHGWSMPLAGQHWSSHAEHSRH